MDWHMPGVNGLEAARRIRGMDGGREVKIAAVTASEFDEQRAELMPAGLDDFARKPHRPEQIFDCMARHLGVKLAARDVSVSADGIRTRSPATDAVTSIPAALRMQLADALLSLDADRVNAVVSEISERDDSLGAMLSEYPDKFAYTELFRAIQRREARGQKGCV